MKTFLKISGISIGLMLVLPFVIVKTVPADAGMAACFMLFFAINPVASCLCGIFLGKNIKKNWYCVLVLPIIFFLSSLIIFSFDMAFTIYAIAYLVLSSVCMIITGIVKK